VIRAGERVVYAGDHPVTQQLLTSEGVVLEGDDGEGIVVVRWPNGSGVHQVGNVRVVGDALEDAYLQ
jgi:hypothetical protein